MKLPFLLLAGSIALLRPSPIAAAVWPMQGHDPQNSNFSSEGGTINSRNLARLHATWTINTTSPTVIDGEGTLYVAFGAAGGVGSFNDRNGSRIRSFSNRFLGIAPQDNVNALAYGNGLLVIASALQTVAVDPRHGRIVWRRSFGATSLVVSDGRIFTGTGCQSACGSPASRAIDLRTGRVLWRHTGNFGSRPVLVGTHLYQTWGENTAITHVYDVATGRLVRSLSLSGQWTGDRQAAYVATGPAPVRSMVKMRANGTVAWKVSLGAPYSYADPALAYGRLYVPSNRFHPGIIAVDVATGEVAWGTAIRSVTSLIVASRLVFVAHTADIDILNADSGRLLRRVDLPPLDVPIDSLLLSNGTLYAVSRAGITAVHL